LAEILTTDPDLVRAALALTPVPWQEAMRRAIRSTAELRRRLGLGPETDDSGGDDSGGDDSGGDDSASGLLGREIARAERDFSTFVPLEYLSRIRPGDPRDPLLAQVMASPVETIQVEGFTADPVGDNAARVSAGMLQKYHGRVLAIPTGVCGIHCRYCFRREFDYAGSADDSGFASSTHAAIGGGDQAPQAGADAGAAISTGVDDAWRPMIERLADSPEVDEVILSGGDPLTLSDAKLDRLIAAIESVPHVARLRIHSRMPVAIPQRVTPELVARLRSSRLACWVVIHCNHPREIDAAVAKSVGDLIDAGIPVLNQAVLLAGVNDDLGTLEGLCRTCVNLRVQPYYLHQLDRVAGAAHFEVPVSRGLELIEGLRRRLPGYAVPTYVTEIAGAASKVPNVGP
jgi:L-lysine 2,3-aminomutase